MPSNTTPLSFEEDAIFRTVAYSSIFDYPLTLREVRRSLLGAALGEEEIRHVIGSSGSLQELVETADGFVFLRGERESIQRRRRREDLSRRVLQSNRRVLKLICALPFTRLVALSGSAAHANIDRSGDIDLFIVTHGMRVWWTAVSILLLTKLLGCRKMLCFNFILSDSRLKVEPQDLFSANQMIHLKPLIGRGLYRRFLAENPFVRRFYPSFEDKSPDFDCRPGPFLSSFKRLLEWILNLGPGFAFEYLCRKTYFAYLKGKSGQWSSPDQVVLEPDYLKLHTESHRKRVLQRFDEVCREGISHLAAQSQSEEDKRFIGCG